MAKTIKVKNYVNVMEELVANAAITPGHLVEVISTGKVQKHATAARPVLPMFAVEDELQGKTISDAYAATDQVQVWIPQRGDIVNAILKNGENVAIGDFLESAGAGELQKHVADVWASVNTGTIYLNQIVGVAVTAVDMSGSSGVDPDGRILVRII